MSNEPNILVSLSILPRQTKDGISPFFQLEIHDRDNNVITGTSAETLMQFFREYRGKLAPYSTFSLYVTTQSPAYAGQGEDGQAIFSEEYGTMTYGITDATIDTVRAELFQMKKNFEAAYPNAIWQKLDLGTPREGL